MRVGRHFGWKISQLEKLPEQFVDIPIFLGWRFDKSAAGETGAQHRRLIRRHRSTHPVEKWSTAWKWKLYLWRTSFLDRICFRRWSWEQGWACLSFCFLETIAEWSSVDLRCGIWFRWSAIVDGQLLRTTRDCQRWRPKGTGHLGKKRETINKHRFPWHPLFSNSLKVAKDKYLHRSS